MSEVRYKTILKPNGERALKRLMQFGVIVAATVAAGMAQAGCPVSADPGAVVRTVNPANQADANLVISMSMMPKLMHLDYKAAAQQPSCDLGALDGDKGYKLWGSDTGGRQRKALPAQKGQPIAVILPVVDMMKAIDSSKTGKAAPTEGYLLLTISKEELTGWRFYTGMPDSAVLKRDMAQALASDGSPIFRNGVDGKTSLFIPKS